MPSIKVTVRLPPNLHAATTRLAKASRRSFNQEVVMAVEQRVRNVEEERATTEYADRHSPDRSDLNTTIKRLQKNRTIERTKGGRK